MDKNQAISTVLKPYLKEDEKVLWADIPAKSFVYLPSDLFSALIGVFWILFSIFWLVLTINPALEGASGTEALMPYLSIPFFIVGLWFVIIKNLIIAIKRRQLVYAITNKRVVAVYTSKEYLEQYLIVDIACAEVKENKNGTGSIFFFSNKNTNKKYSTSGIFAINNVKEVSEIIFKKVRKK
jgi:hypothetical protein